MSEKFERVSIKREISRDIHEHEIFLSFHDDEGAEYFSYWFESEGRKQFADYLKRKGKENLIK